MYFYFYVLFISSIYQLCCHSLIYFIYFSYFFVQIKQTAYTIMKRSDQIPPERLEELKQEIKGFLNKSPNSELTPEDVAQVCELQGTQENPNYKPHEQLVVEAIGDDTQKLEHFVKKWRYHFINTMQPKFLPLYWQADRPLDASGEGRS